MQLSTVMSGLTFPLGFYTDFIREHQYGMATQSVGPIAITLLTAAGFAVVARSFDRLRRRVPRWGIGSVADVAGLPLIALLFGAYQFVSTPITNTVVRTNEQEAGIFGLNASRQPDGFANAALKLGEYRKLAPGPLEELVFFDHPSGRTRILTAMCWKGEQAK